MRRCCEDMRRVMSKQEATPSVDEDRRQTQSSVPIDAVRSFRRNLLSNFGTQGIDVWQTPNFDSERAKLRQQILAKRPHEVDRYFKSGLSPKGKHTKGGWYRSALTKSRPGCDSRNVFLPSGAATKSVPPAVLILEWARPFSACAETRHRSDILQTSLASTSYGPAVQKCTPLF